MDYDNIIIFPINKVQVISDSEEHINEYIRKVEIIYELEEELKKVKEEQ